jgi:hypothetical protein
MMLLHGKFRQSPLFFFFFDLSPPSEFMRDVPFSDFIATTTQWCFVSVLWFWGIDPPSKSPIINTGL